MSEYFTDAVPIISVIASSLKNSYSLFQELTKQNYFIRKIGRVDWDKETLTVDWHIKRDSSIKGLNKSLKLEAIEFASYKVFPQTRSLNGFIHFEDNQLTIDFDVVNQIEEHETVNLIFQIKFNKGLYGGLCKVNNCGSIRNTSNDGREFNFSVVLDRAELWLDSFDSFEYVNVPNEINLRLNQDDIKRLAHILRDTYFANHEPAKRLDALRELEYYNNNIQTYLENELGNISPFYNDIFDIVADTGSINLGKTKPNLQQFKLENGNTIILPTEFVITLLCDINGRDMAIKVRVIFYIKEFIKHVEEVYKKFK